METVYIRPFSNCSIDRLARLRSIFSERTGYATNNDVKGRDADYNSASCRLPTPVPRWHGLWGKHERRQQRLCQLTPGGLTIA